MYCKFVNFRKNLIFANSVKDIFVRLKIGERFQVYIYQ